MSTTVDAARLALAVEAIQREPLLAEILPILERHTQAAIDLWRVLKMDQEGGGQAELHIDVPPAAPVGKKARQARSRLVLRPATPRESAEKP